MRLKILSILLALSVVLMAPFWHTFSQSPAIIELNADGSWNYIVTPTPYVVTNTPSASQTPWIITATPSDSPTQEVFTPTFTPTHTPTVTPTPDVGTCYGTVLVTLRIRDKAITGDTVGFWVQGDRVIISDIFYDDISSTRSDEWVEVISLDGNLSGWSASYYNFNEYIEYDISQACSDLLFPPPQVALLWHTVPGFNIGNARISHNILENKNIEFGYKSFADINSCIETLEAGGTCIFRHGNPDCPQNIGTADPRTSAREFLQDNALIAVQLAKYEKAYYEPVNECWYGDENHPEIFVWWAEWLDEYLNNSAGLPKLVIPTLGPGHGSVMMFQAWKSVLERNEANGGLFGEHAYTPYHDNGLCSCDEWLACRHRTNEEYRQSIGLSIHVAITEAARGWGNDPVDVNDFTCWYEEIKNDDFLHSVSLWLLGFHRTWPNANLDNYVIPLANNIE